MLFVALHNQVNHVALYRPNASELGAFCCPLIVHRSLTNPGLGYEVVATATLIATPDRRFLITAAHVVDEWGDQPLLFPSSDGARSLPSDPVAYSEKDRLDFAVFILPDEVQLPPEFNFLPIEAVAIGGEAPANIQCELYGYPGRLRGRGQMLEAGVSHLRAHTLAPTGYPDAGLDPSIHLAVGRERGEVKRPDDQVVALRPLAGMSGGPMWLLAGEDQYVLGGITTDSHETRPVIFGTRVSHIGESIGAALAGLQPDSDQGDARISAVDD